MMHPSHSEHDRHRLVAYAHSLAVPDQRRWETLSSHLASLRPDFADRYPPAFSGG